MIVALLGAECTGKSSLGAALAQRLGAAFVPEHLRDWCLAAGRTPRQHEQAAIAAAQQRHIAAAAAGLVIADTTALMTAVYSQHYFGDDSLLADALRAQRAYALTLLCTPEGIPWQAAGLLRDGEAARQQVHLRLQTLLHNAALPYRRLDGSLQNRVEQAHAWILDALCPR